MKQKKRSEIKEEDTWDLSVLYKNTEAFKEEYKKLKDDIKEIEKYKGKLLESADTLLNFLKLEDTLERRLYKLYYYAHLNFDVDTTNAKSLELTAEISQLITIYSTLTSFVDPELLKAEYAKILNFYNEKPELLTYRFNLENLYRYKKHTLKENEEKILSTLSEALNASDEIYESLTDSDLTFGNIVVDGKRIEFTESNYSTFIESNDRKVRQKAFNILFKNYQKYIHTIANTFRFHVETASKLAKLKHYESSLAASLFQENIDIKVYENLIKTVRENLSTLYDYYNLKKEVLGLDKLHLYDIYANMVSDIDVKYTFDEAKNIVLDALGILGTDYQKKLTKAFNNRFIDIYNNKGKRSGAYSSGFYDTPPYILLNYEGGYSDLTTLAHELGHSMHTMYSCENNPYNTSSYQIFVAEVASTVNELLLLKYLLKKTDSKKEKLFLLNKLLELFKGTIFRQTMFAEFEKNMYESHEKGIVLTPEYLNSEYYKLVCDYFGRDAVKDKLIQYEWMRIPHFYYNFYVYKYAIGLSAACKIVHDIELNGEKAISNYLAFLKTGGSMYPSEELKIAGVDISSPEFIEEAISMFEGTISEFREIYRK